MYKISILKIYFYFYCTIIATPNGVLSLSYLVDWRLIASKAFKTDFGTSELSKNRMTQQLLLQSRMLLFCISKQKLV